MTSVVRLEKIPFADTKSIQIKKQIDAAANMSDEEIIAKADINAHKKAQKSPWTKLNNAIPYATIGAFVLDDMAKAKIKVGDVIKSAPPSGKIAKGFGSLAYWLIWIASLKSAGSITEKLTNDVKDNNTKAMLDVTGTLAGGMALSSAITALLNKGLAKFAEKMPGAMNDIGKKALAFDKNFAENGFVKTVKQHIAEPLKKFASSHPKLTGFTSKYSKGLIFAGSLLAIAGLQIKTMHDRNKNFEKNVENMYELKNSAEIASQILNEAQEKYDKAFSRPIEAKTNLDELINE